MMIHSALSHVPSIRSRSGRIGAALAALCLLATALLTACSAFPYSHQTITAQVKAIDGQTLTLQPGASGGAPTEPAPMNEAVAFERLGDEAFTVGDTSVYTVDEATRAQATYDPSLFDASVPISFNGEAIAYDNPQVTNEVVDGVTVLTIGAGGSYELAGTLPAGRIVIDTPESVRLGLGGVTIANEKGAVVERTQPGLLVLASAAGTSNTLTTKAPADGDAGVAAVSGWGAVIVTGEGALMVESSSGNGIEALAAKTTDTATDAAAATSDENAAATDDATAPVAGVIGIESATLGVSAGHHGLYAADYLAATGGVLDITASEDALASDGDARIAGGDFAVDAGDDAIHGDFVAVVEGGTFTAGRCEEGIEAERLFLRDGAVAITSNDDGVNAAAPEAYDDAMPADYTEAEHCVIAIGGGAWRIDASGDGLDSNGSLQMNGGTLLVSAPESGDNSALDCDGQALLVSGTALLVGAPGMSRGFSEADQPYVNVAVTGAADETVTLARADGSVLISWMPPKGFTVACATAPGLLVDEQLSLVVGGEITPLDAVAASGVLAGAATSGVVSGGTTTAAVASTAAASGSGGSGARGTPAAGAPGAAPDQAQNSDAGAQGGPSARMYGAPEGASGQQPKAEGASADGATPPTPPDGDGATPPTPPEGDNGSDAGTPPTSPEGSGGTPPARPGDDGTNGDAGATSSPDNGGNGGDDANAMPPTPPDGAADGATPPGASSAFEASDAAEITVTVSADIAATLAVDDIVEVTFGDGDAVDNLTVLGSAGAPDSAAGPAGNATATDNGTATTTIDTDQTIDGATYVSQSADENALRVTDGATATLKAVTIEKSGDTTNQDASNFRGMNAGLLVTDGATAKIEDARAATTASGANAVFAQGDGATVEIERSAITTAADNSGGLMVAGGGTLRAREVTVDTAGRSAAALRSDRGGGTMEVTGGSYTTSGTGSPVIYSTADISVADATLDAAASEAVVIEGKNSVSLENCEVSGAMEGTYGPDSGENIHGVMIYQSMSGDAAAGESSFSMDGGFLGTAAGDLFYVTNTACTISVTDVEMGLGDGVLLRVAGNDGAHGWGEVGQNGGQCMFNATNETLAGAITVDAISSLGLTLAESTYEGAINEADEGGTVGVTLDGGSTWTLTADSHISSFSGDLSAVNANGHGLYVGGERVL